MTKFLKVSVVAATLLVSSAFAGTVNTVPYTIAQEFINGQASGALNVGTSIFTATSTVDAHTTNDNAISGYSPTAIPAISLANGTVTLSASAGNLAVAPSAVTKTIAIMEDNAVANSDKIIAIYANTYAGKLSFASDASVSFTNGKSYRLAEIDNATKTPANIVGAVLTDANSPAIAAGNITLSGVAMGSTSVNFTTSLLSTDTQTERDAATNTLVLAQRQVTSTVATAANGVIDSDQAFKLFTVASAEALDATKQIDVVTVNVTTANLDTQAVSATDVVTIKLTADKALPATMTATYTNANDVAVPCTIAADKLSVTCTDAATALFANDGTNLAYAITLDGAGDLAMANSTFTATVGYDFSTPLNVDYVMGMNPVDTMAAGAWTYSGATLKAPYLVNSAAAASFARISNESGQTAKVYVDIFDEAGEKVSGVLLGEIAPHASELYLATDMIAAAKTAGGSATLASADSGRFTAVFLVTAPAANVYGTAVVKQISGADRVTPMKDNSGFAQ